MNAGHSGRKINEFLKTKQPRRMSISVSTASGLQQQATTNENRSEHMSYFEDSNDTWTEQKTCAKHCEKRFRAAAGDFAKF
jgi:hypothetical protein